VAGVAGPFENRLDVPDKIDPTRRYWGRRLLPISLCRLSISGVSEYETRNDDHGNSGKPLAEHLSTTPDGSLAAA
jgi:hypothetical protein